MSLKLLDVNKFLQSKQSKAITNPRSFDNKMEPNQGGLQDPTIFGISTKDKFSSWGYINLEDVVLHPLIYDNLNIIDPIFKRVLLKKIKVNLVNGMIEESKTGSGSAGLSWIITNWSKINFDKYKTEKNKLFIEFLNNTNSNMIFINKVPVIPLVYREAHMGTFKMEADELDELYEKILNISKTGRSDFTSEWMKAMKDSSGKEILQDKVNQLFQHFVSKLEGKRGFIRNTLTAKRLDNVARMVANARPDIPINSAVLPWHILLNIFDIFVVAYIQNDESGEYAKKLGMTEKTLIEFGESFDYIYRNATTYVEHYPGRKEIWIEILTNILNDNPMMRILLKRDPGWNADSIWCFQPLINTDESYQIWVPSWVYKPLGGDSINTNFLITTKNNNTVYEDNDFLVTCSEPKARVVKTMDSVWNQI